LATPQGEETLRTLHTTQRKCGASWVNLLNRDSLNKEFPWLNLEGLSMGSYSSINEGYFDPWSLLKAMRNKVLAQPKIYNYIHIST
jgi:FAD-dependent oxidoreductase domain-containing protein 1